MALVGASPKPGSVGLGSGGLTKSDSGVMVLNASSDYTGATTISQGTLRLVPVTGPPVAGARRAWRRTCRSAASRSAARTAVSWEAASSCTLRTSLRPLMPPLLLTFSTAS